MLFSDGFREQIPVGLICSLPVKIKQGTGENQYQAAALKVMLPWLMMKSAFGVA